MIWYGGGRILNTILATDTTGRWQDAWVCLLITNPDVGARLHGMRLPPRPPPEPRRVALQRLESYSWSTFLINSNGSIPLFWVNCMSLGQSWEWKKGTFSAAVLELSCESADKFHLFYFMQDNNIEHELIWNEKSDRSIIKELPSMDLIVLWLISKLLSYL